MALFFSDLNHTWQVELCALAWRVNIFLTELWCKQHWLNYFRTTLKTFPPSPIPSSSMPKWWEESRLSGYHEHYHIHPKQQFQNVNISRKQHRHDLVCQVVPSPLCRRWGSFLSPVFLTLNSAAPLPDTATKMLDYVLYFVLVRLWTLFFSLTSFWHVTYPYLCIYCQPCWIQTSDSPASIKASISSSQHSFPEIPSFIRTFKNWAFSYITCQSRGPGSGSGPWDNYIRPSSSFYTIIINGRILSC